MQLREKILAIALVGTLLLGGAWSAVHKFYLNPRADKIAESKSLEDQAFDQELLSRSASAKLDLLAYWKDRSLPADPQQASRRYQEWLTDLAAHVGKFTDAKVRPDKISPDRSGAFTTIGVTITGQARLEQIRDFLYRFYRTDLLQRIVRLNLEGQASEGNPMLTFTLTAEGMSVTGAEPGGETLFPRTELAQDLDENDTRLSVQGSSEFPEKTPFDIHIGDEYLTVEEVEDNTWTVQRGTPLNQTRKHGQGDTVELAPVNPDMRNRTVEEFDAIVKLNPFAKPTIEVAGDMEIIRGKSLDLTVSALGIGDPDYDFAVPPPADMQNVHLNRRTGVLTWQPEAQQVAKQYSFTVQASADGLRQPLTQALNITFRDVNTPPVLDAVAEQTAVMGTELVVKLTAADKDEPKNKLTFSLGEGAPAGAAIDPATGNLRWVPTPATPPGSVEVAVVVTDDGTPPMTATGKVAINLADDIAQYTYLTAYVSADGERQAWLYDRSANKRLILTEGNPMKYAGIDAFVLAIGEEFVLLQIQDDTWRLGLGQHLRQMERLESQTASQTTNGSEDRQDGNIQ